MTTLNIDKIVEYRNQLKKAELQEFTFHFPVDKSNLQLTNWIKLSQIKAKFNFDYKLKYFKYEQKYYLSFIDDGMIIDSLVVNKNDIKKHNNRIFIKRHIIGEWLRNQELVK